MRKKLVITLLLTALATTSIAGCGKKETATNVTAENTEAVAEINTEAETEELVVAETETEEFEVVENNGIDNTDELPNTNEDANGTVNNNSDATTNKNNTTNNSTSLNESSVGTTSATNSGLNSSTGETTDNSNLADENDSSIGSSTSSTTSENSSSSTSGENSINSKDEPTENTDTAYGEVVSSDGYHYYPPEDVDKLAFINWDYMCGTYTDENIASILATEMPGYNLTAVHSYDLEKANSDFFAIGYSGKYITSGQLTNPDTCETWYIYGQSK